jgi:hypothetical protein
LAPERVALPAGHPLARLTPVAAAVGLLALVATFALGGGDGHQLHASYLVAFLYWWTVALGGLFFVLSQYASRAGWSVAVRRLAEHTAGTLPLFAVLFIPVAAGIELFHWSHADATVHDELLAGKAAYLNPGFFYVRAAAYLAVWAFLGWWFRRRSLQQDVSRDPRTTKLLQSASAPALVVFAVTLTFASFDWIMSLDPHWYSTIFGVYVFSGSTVAILALVTILAVACESWGQEPPLEGLVTAEHYHDLGKLLFGFVVFWAYIAFSQFMLIWYGNIPEETAWYAERLHGTWRGATLALALGHFVLPFFYLIFRRVKRRRSTLVAGCVWLLAVHYLDLYWLAMPAIHPEGFAPSLLDLTAFVGVGGLFLAAVGWLARKPALLPVGDPRLPESLSFENM